MKCNLLFPAVALLLTFACRSLAMWGSRDSVKFNVTRERVLESLAELTQEVYSEASVKRVLEGLPIELISHVQTEEGVSLKFKRNFNEAELFDQMVADKLLNALSKFPMAHDVILLPNENAVKKITLEIQRSDVEFFFRLAHARIFSPVTIPTLILSNYQLVSAMSKIPEILEESSGGVHGLVVGRPGQDHKRVNREFPHFTQEGAEDSYRFLGWTWSPVEVEGTRNSFNVTVERENVKRQISRLLFDWLADEKNLRSTFHGTPFQLGSYQVVGDAAVMEIHVERKGLDAAKEAMVDYIFETIVATPFAKHVIWQVPEDKVTPYPKPIDKMTVEVESDDLNTVFRFITRGMFDRDSAVQSVMANEKFAMAIKRSPGAGKWLAETAKTLWSIGD